MTEKPFNEIDSKGQALYQFSVSRQCKNPFLQARLHILQEIYDFPFEPGSCENFLSRTAVGMLR
jgi:hypothetical protein